MTLSSCRTRTTVEFKPDADSHHDEVLLRSEAGVLKPAPDAFRARVVQHLDRIREQAGQKGAFRVATFNSFPSAAGIASSASGFSALAAAASDAIGLSLDADQLSVLARLSGSGSAARSVFGGYVEWPVTDSSGEACAGQIAGPDHWALCDLVVIVETGPKQVSSRAGHRLATTSPHFAQRQRLLPERLRLTRQAIDDRDIERLGTILEQEAIDLHLIAMSSVPPVFYWQPGTLQVIHALRALRADGLIGYFTMDAGANVHVICEPDHAEQLAECLTQLPLVERVMRDRVGDGTRTEPEHLF